MVCPRWWLHGGGKAVAGFVRVVALVVVLGACGGQGSEISEPLDDSSAAPRTEPTQPTASTAAASAVPATTTSLVTTAEEALGNDSVTSTSAASPGDAPSVSYPAQGSAATDTPDGWNRAGGFAVGLDGDSGEVVAIDLRTGAIERSLAWVDVEARWFGRFQLDWAGTAVYYFVQTEDYWFSCESSPGSVVRLDLLSGEQTRLAAGGEPQVSPDGKRLAYLAASQCLPDPGDPANFVETPYDSVVVRDLASGEEHTWVDSDLQADLSTAEADFIEAQLGGLAWLGPDELAVGDRRLSTSTMAVIGLGADLKGEAGGVQRIVGFDQSTGLVLVEQDVYLIDGRRARLVGVDPVTGQTMIYATTSSADALFAFDSQNRNLVGLDDGQVIADGREITLQANVNNLDW